jgi:hypothetical protein
MIETLPTVGRPVAEHLVRALLEQSGIADESLGEEAMAAALQSGCAPIRFATMNLELGGVRYVVTLRQDRATVMPEDERHRHFGRRPQS